MDAEQLHQLLDRLTNQSQPYTEMRRLVSAVRKAAYLFLGHPQFDLWVEAILTEFGRPEGVPFVVENPLERLPGATLEPLDHVGSKDPRAPTFRRWVDEKGKPLVLNPHEDCGGSDAESHYAAPALWAEIRKEQEGD